MVSRRFRTPAVAAGLAATAAAGAVFAAIGTADPSNGPNLTHVPTANNKANGYSPASKLSPELQQIAWAQGSTRLENPSGIIDHYGYERDVASADNPSLPQMVPTAQNPNEAQKTEPDKNTYLVLRGQSGPDSSYDYGTHFLYQGHENAARDSTPDRNRLGYITRINLDADAAHRVTLLATNDNTGKPISTIDGSTWDPFARRLLLTTESSNAPTYAATANYPSTVEDVSGALGRGGYEGIQNDSQGNLWIAEDIGGANKPGTTAKQPNSFIYRYVPRQPGDLHNGKLQALQVDNGAGQPITFESQAAFPSADQTELHSYGHELNTRWVTVHDTANSSAPFNANAAAKAAHATPFKRPENGVFRPGTGFKEFYFDETGDTNATSAENGDPDTGAGGAGGWGGVQKLVQSSPSADTGKLTLFYRGNRAHTGLDNITFLSRDKVALGEDAGDTLHSQRNALDSAFVFDTRADYSNSSTPEPVRWLAEGRDPSATIDSSGNGFGKNDGDNETTGIIVSNGDPGAGGILGAAKPNLFQDGWRWFWSQQHGENVAYEIIPSPRFGAGDSNGQKERSR